MIQVREITKKYGQKKVVDQVSMTIPKGKITSFIGPNGAGKSTVLSILAESPSPPWVSISALTRTRMLL